MADVLGHEFLPQLLASYLLYLAAAMTPGPNLLVISDASMRRSRSHGLATAAGVSTGTLAFLAAALSGVAAVVQAAPHAASLVRALGAAYLIYLGIGALRRATRPSRIAPSGGPTSRTLARAYLTGLLTHLGNPKAVLFYLSLMTMVVTPSTPLSVRLATVAGIAALSFGWYGAAALSLSTPAIRGLYVRGARWVDGALGLALVGAGAALALADED